MDAGPEGFCKEWLEIKFERQIENYYREIDILD